MANDQSVCVASANRDVDNENPCTNQDCSDVIHISVFFDGTGNNKDADEATKRWSNVARIWRAAEALAEQGKPYYPIYISGVGTKFNGKPLSPSDQLKIDIEDNLGGGVAGAGGTRRVDYGQQQINDALRNVLLTKARSQDGEVAKYAKNGQQQSFSDVNRFLAKHRLIKQINVSIIGFSRGAALARAFCNQWLWQCKEEHGQLSYEGYPIRFVFLGLFDTVASFGLPATNSANYTGFKGHDLVVDERVERCVHQVAAHELRFSFPVDLIRRNGKLDGRWEEKVYPGVHSDIGGGYEPIEQGIDNNYSRIPMRDMMREALLAGTRLVSYDALAQNKLFKALFSERFECKPETESAYKAYCAQCKPGGSVEKQVQKHMEQLYSAYGTLHRQGGENLTQREHRKGHSWSRLAPDDMAKELENYDKAMRNLTTDVGASIAKSVAGGDATYLIRQGAYAMWISPKPWQRQAWQQKSDDKVMAFIHGYVHDSKVGFLSNAEPWSYFSKRGISESSHSVQGWFEDNVARPVDQAYEKTIDAASKGIEKGVNAAKKAGHAVSDAANQGMEAAKSLGGDLTKATQNAANGLKSAWHFITQ